MGPRFMNRGKAASVTSELPKNYDQLCERRRAASLQLSCDNSIHELNLYEQMTYDLRAAPGIPSTPRHSRTYRVTKLGYSAISPVSTRASNLVWISSNRR